MKLEGFKDLGFESEFKVNSLEFCKSMSSLRRLCLPSLFGNIDVTQHYLNSLKDEAKLDIEEAFDISLPITAEQSVVPSFLITKAATLLHEEWLNLFPSALKKTSGDLPNLSDNDLIMNWMAGTRYALLTLPVLDRDGLHTDLRLPSGLCIVGGLSGSGKSTFLRYISVKRNAEYIVFCEPDIPAITDNVMLYKAIMDFIHSEDEILIIDSISKFLIAEGKTAAAAGGINNMLLNAFVELNNMLMMIGKLIIVSINYADKEDQVTRLHTAYSGKVSSYIAWGSKDHFTLQTRLNRNRTDKSYSMPDMSVKEVKVRGKGQEEEIKVTKPILSYNKFFELEL